MFTVTEAFAKFKLNLEFAKAEKRRIKKLIIIRLARDAASAGDSTTAINLAIKYYKYSGGGYNPCVNAIMIDALMQHVTSLVKQAREVRTLDDKLVFAEQAFTDIEKYKKWLKIRTLDDKLVFAQQAFTDIEKYKKWLMPYSRKDTVYHLQMMAGEIID
jgi:hypothetical protein